jgi:hypothetical protein
VCSIVPLPLKNTVLYYTDSGMWCCVVWWIHINIQDPDALTFRASVRGRVFLQNIRDCPCRLQGIISQNTAVWILTAVRPSNLTWDVFLCIFYTSIYCIYINLLNITKFCITVIFVTFNIMKLMFTIKQKYTYVLFHCEITCARCGDLIIITVELNISFVWLP